MTFGTRTLMEENEIHPLEILAGPPHEAKHQNPQNPGLTAPTAPSEEPPAEKLLRPS